MEHIQRKLADNRSSKFKSYREFNRLRLATGSRTITSDRTVYDNSSLSSTFELDTKLLTSNKSVIYFCLGCSRNLKETVAIHAQRKRTNAKNKTTASSSKRTERGMQVN